MPDSRPGTYALLLSLKQDRQVFAGRARRSFALRAGLHVYVGSALGPGGLESRLRRHAGSPKKLHWHIDYLLAEVKRVGALYKVSTRRLECSWASWFASRSTTLIEGFGASDCTCDAHLVRLPARQSVRRLVAEAEKSLGASFEDWRT